MGTDNPELNFTEEEKAELRRLLAKREAIINRGLVRNRESLRAKGEIAEKLEDLKSEYGLFIEEEGRRYEDMKIAYAGRAIWERESAYLCAPADGQIFEYDHQTYCGWVKGEPIEKKYDEIGPLCGSAGVDYYCRICGRHIGRHASMFS